MITHAVEGDRDRQPLAACVLPAQNTLVPTSLTQSMCAEVEVERVAALQKEALHEAAAALPAALCCSTLRVLDYTPPASPS
jgi:hypothetical protein